MKYESGVHRVQRVPETESRRTYPYLYDHSGSDAGGRGCGCCRSMKRISVLTSCGHPETVDSVSIPQTLQCV